MSVLEREGEDSAKNPGSGPSWLLPQWPCPRSPSLSSQLQVHPGARILDPLAMRVVRGLDPLPCLLLLVFLDPHSPEGGHLPQRRFEYKLSFKGPRLALPGVGIPFWSHHGDAIPGLEEVRLAPSMRNRSGAVWSTTPILFPAWEVEIQMRVTGPGRRGAQGMVSLNSGLTPSDPDEVCVDVGPLLLAPGGFFGVSAATSILADDHDVLSFLTFSLREPGPEPPSQPFLETEQLRLEKQLEGLRARLGLGTKEDMTPKLNYGVQEEGEQSFGLEEKLHRHRQILQTLQGLSKHLAQAEQQWKQQLGSPGQIRPEGGWDSAKVSALLRGQQNLLQNLQEMRDAAAHMASRAQVFYLPVGTKHHFSELAQILSLLQKDLRGPARAAAKGPRSPGRSPRVSSCLQPGIFLFFLLIQTVGFFCYVHFSKQKLDKGLQDYLSTCSLPLSSTPQIPRALGALRRQPFSPSIQA
nr:protein ERGIC-53-like isoform X1 [Odocoileus virginianus texanus]